VGCILSRGEHEGVSRDSGETGKEEKIHLNSKVKASRGYKHITRFRIGPMMHHVRLSFWPDSLGRHECLKKEKTHHKKDQKVQKHPGRASPLKKGKETISRKRRRGERVRVSGDHLCNLGVGQTQLVMLRVE